MALFFRTYDLRKKRDYQKLYDELVEFKAVRVLESTLCFNRGNTTAAGLRDYFKKSIDDDDVLLVVESKDWASWAADGDANELNK
jgi:hypothetical protein